MNDMFVLCPLVSVLRNQIQLMHLLFKSCNMKTVILLSYFVDKTEMPVLEDNVLLIKILLIICLHLEILWNL